MTHPHCSRRRLLAAGAATGLPSGVSGCLQDLTDQSTVSIDTSVPEDPVTVTVPYPLGDIDETAIETNLRAAGLPEQITVDIVDYGQRSASYLATYRRVLFEGAPEPALQLTDSGWLSVLAAEQPLVNLSEALPDELLDTVDRSYLEMARQTARYDGSYYGIPMYVDLGTILYRMDLIEQAGYDPEAQNWATEPPNWETFGQVAEAATASSDARFGFTVPLDNYPGLACCTFNEFMSSFGGAYFGGLDTLFGPVGERPITVTEQPVLDALEVLRAFVTGVSGTADDTYATDIVPRAAINWSSSQAQQQFFRGNAVFHRGWPFEIVAAANRPALEGRLGVMPIPAGVSESAARYEGTGGPVSALGGWHCSLNPFASEESLQGAYHVIETMMTETFKLRMLQTDGLLPPEPALLTAEQMPDATVLDQFAEALQVASENAIARPVTPVWTTQSQVLADHVNSVFSRFREPRAAMTDLHDQLRSIETNGP